MVNTAKSDSDNEKASEYEKMFLDKLTLLNRTFLKVIKSCVDEMPDADLSPTVKDYLKHVRSLDEMYGGKCVVEKTEKRPIKIAKRSKTFRRIDDSMKVRNISRIGSVSSTIVPEPTATSTPTIKQSSSTMGANSDKKSDLQGEISRKPLPFGTSSTAGNLPSGVVASVPKFDFGSTPESKAPSDDSGRRGRKRANRGDQGGGDEFVIITPKRTLETVNVDEKDKKSNQLSSGSLKKDSTSVSSPAEVTKEKSTFASSIFSAKSDVSSNTARAKAVPTLSFGSATDKTAKKKDDSCKNTDTRQSDIKDDKTGTSKVTSPLSFNASASNVATGTPFVFGKTNSTSNAQSASGSPGNKAPLFNIGKSTTNAGISSDKPKLSFSSSSSVFKTSSEVVFSFNASKAGSNEVSAVKPLAPESLSGFKFGATGSSAGTSTPAKPEEKEEEYAPPKPETVLQEEPNAILSTKCSVFVLKGKEYEKIGIGQLHIKKDEDNSEKKILLIRAATTIGTVWVNSYVDKNTKVSKADETKLRVSCVNGTTPNTYLIRLPNANIREQVEEQLKL
uniref:RanBD1 domain-containing protein n=1 Tax=Syphacia muris TaxID=451379 RepID=A0A0N5A7Z1_9BILA